VASQTRLKADRVALTPPQLRAFASSTSSQKTLAAIVAYMSGEAALNLIVDRVDYQACAD